MNRLIKCAAVLLVSCGISIHAWAGTSAIGYFASPLPSTQSLTPGQTFPVTLTANTNQVGGMVFSAPFSLSPNVGNQFVVVPGGTCAVGTPYTNGQTCTVLVQFLGTTSGSFTATLLGQCQFNAQVGGYGINCVLGTQSALGRFAGNGIAAVVDALGASGLSLLMLAVLGMGAFFTLRRTA
jgi:hypothetical protein